MIKIKEDEGEGDEDEKKKKILTKKGNLKNVEGKKLKRE